MDNMNDEQMQKLAKYIAADLTKRIYGIANPATEDNEMMWYADRDDDHCVGELARLMTLSALYEEREEYEKCAAIKKHIDKINLILDKL